MPVRDEKNRLVARYAYWVEDLQSRVDPAIAGNQKGAGGTHARAAWPFPAAGLNDQPEDDDEPALDQIAVFAIDPAATEAAQGELGKRLFAKRGMLISPDAQLAAAGIKPPLTRVTTASTDTFPGDLADPKARAIERGLVTGLQPYEEQPLVPYADGIDPAAAGKPKLNLNRLLATGGDAAVDEMADFIRTALPKFEQRKGGFPEDYLKTLAANAIDYADQDSESTLESGSHRGIDAFPLVSEFLFKSRWENVRTVGPRKFLDLSTTVYVELWNMSNVPVSGQAQISYETKYRFQIPPNPNLVSLDDLSRASHSLSQSAGYNWFPACNVTLQPNEYRVFKCGTVNYSWDAAPASGFITSPIDLTGESFAAGGSGYRMRWNGRLVDQTRGGVHRNDSRINYPADTKDQPRQRVRTTVSGHSYNRGGGFINNMGDPRMSAYLSAPQDANVYPQNYSPNRRNIREGSIYNSNPNFVYGRVLPSEWPDGGHDSPFGSANVHGLIGYTSAAFTDDHRVEPDAPGFFTQMPSLALGREEAPLRLSNLGRFYSATELGRTYDPVMWQVRATTNTVNTPGTAWGDVLANSPPSSDYGGGNTLRVGRPEHPGFDKPGMRAAQLLDLFHAGRSRSDDASEREGPVAEIDGHLNLNTASKPALRQLIAGRLRQDPEMRRFVRDAHDSSNGRRYPQVQKLNPTGSPAVPDITAVADRIADAIIASRPFASGAELANVRETSGGTTNHVFGNARLFAGYTGTGFPVLQWTDSAAEETFARVFEASTVRSRNFRVWVVAQAVAPTTSTTAKPVVLAEVRKAFNVFADPGERKPDGTHEPSNFLLRVLHENDF